MYSAAAKGRAGGSAGRLRVLLAGSCALLLMLYAPRRRTTAVLGQTVQRRGEASSAEADSSSATAAAAGGTESAVCKLLPGTIGKGPFAQSCHLLEDVCVDQV